MDEANQSGLASISLSPVINETINAGTTYNASGTIQTDNFEDAQADLTREQWEDYKNRFLPVQNELIALSQNNELLDQQLARNEENLANSNRLADLNQGVKMSRFGLSNTKSAQQSNNSSLSQSLASASVNNETRQSNEDLQNKIMMGQGG